MGVDQVSQIQTRERVRASEQFDRDDAERVEIAAFVGREGQDAELLGRHVEKGADRWHRLTARLVALMPAEPEVQQLGHEPLAVVGDHDVRWLDVTVQDAPAVRMRQGQRQLSQQICHSDRRQRAILGKDARQRAAVGQFGDQIGLRVLRAMRQQGHDPRVRQLRQQPGFVFELHTLVESDSLGLAQQFDSHLRRVRRRVAGKEHAGARSATQRPQQAVAGDEAGHTDQFSIDSTFEQSVVPVCAVDAAGLSGAVIGRV